MPFTCESRAMIPDAFPGSMVISNIRRPVAAPEKVQRRMSRSEVSVKVSGIVAPESQVEGTWLRYCCIPMGKGFRLSPYSKELDD